MLKKLWLWYWHKWLEISEALFLLAVFGVGWRKWALPSWWNLSAIGQRWEHLRFMFLTWRRKWKLTSVFLPRKFHGQKTSGLQSSSVSSVQSLSRILLFATPWIAACQASLSITNSRSSLKLTSIKSVMPSSHLILCHPLLPLPPIPPSIRVFSNESTLRMRWPKS